jgi:hypothetical protein
VIDFVFVTAAGWDFNNDIKDHQRQLPMIAKG